MEVINPTQNTPARPQRTPTLLCIGVGNAGCNIVDHIQNSNALHVDYLAIDTDLQKLDALLGGVPFLQIGQTLTQGEGTGGDAELGYASAEEERDHLTDLLSSYRLVIVVTGLSGGTGGGATTYIAEVCQQISVPMLVYGIHPWGFEHSNQFQLANGRLGMLIERGAVVVNVRNTKIEDMFADEQSLMDRTVTEAFQVIDNVIDASIVMLVDMIHESGLINIDFADTRSVLSYQGIGFISIVTRQHAEDIENIIEEMVTNPLFDATNGLNGQALLVYVILKPNFPATHWRHIQAAISERLSKADHHKIGLRVDHNADYMLQILVVSTGIDVPPDVIEAKEHLLHEQQKRQAHIEQATAGARGTTKIRPDQSMSKTARQASSKNKRVPPQPGGARAKTPAPATPAAPSSRGTRRAISVADDEPPKKPLSTYIGPAHD
ncbi:MAG: hypothetical protein K0U36_00655 [Alphaproteobacteria bacterium]|nr:hypothetical protein [Alphaproteobacteria bacterium]